MLSGWSASAVLPPLNHLLRQGGWAPARLQPYAGYGFVVDVFPFSVALAVSADGLFEVAAPDTTPAATLRLSPLLLARIAARDPMALRSVVIDGDAQFAAALGSVFRDLEWDMEADLSRVVGDIAAHRLAAGVHSAQAWQRNALDSVQRMFTEYATEESPLLVKRHHVAAFVAEVDAVRDQTARLEKRLQLFSEKS
jgi:ubiquinone biosynthesis protein UbiJ